MHNELNLLPVYITDNELISAYSVKNARVRTVNIQDLCCGIHWIHGIQAILERYYRKNS